MGKKNDTAKPVAASAAPPAQKITTPPAAVQPAAPAPANGDGPAPRAAAKKKPAAPAKAKAPAKKTAKFTTEDVALKAYFISEHRHRHGIHGDSHSDWIEAERQLRAEARKKAAKKTPAKKRQ